MAETINTHLVKSGETLGKTNTLLENRHLTQSIMNINLSFRHSFQS